MSHQHLSLGFEALVNTLARQRPTAVYYVATGGRVLGCALARELSVPAVPIDICYPMSAPLRRTPRWLAALLWPLKEIAYKISTPRCHTETVPRHGEGPVVLVDDSASSGKTLRIALSTLGRFGIEPEHAIRVVGRCGNRARKLVNFSVEKAN